MKSTEILNKIKTFLGEEKIEQEETQVEETQLEESQEKVELAQAKLDNGTILEAEAFEAGNEIFIVTEDERVAMPVGEYMMEDGQMLVVSEEGIIGEIKAQEAEEEVEAEEEEEMAYVSKEEFNSAVEEIKGMINELKDKKEEMAEVEEQVKQELSETPATEPITHNPEAKENLK